MPLSRADRKDRLPFGAGRRIAAACGVEPSFVSSVVNETAIRRTPKALAKVARVQGAIARELGLEVSEAFANPVELPDQSAEASKIPA
jgi:hypothetical protein